MKDKKLIVPLIIGVLLMSARLIFPMGTVASAVFTVLMPVPFLYAMRRAETGRQVLLTALAFAAGFVLLFWGYLSSWWQSIIVFGLSGLYIFLAFFMDRRYSEHCGFCGTLIFPAVWVVLLGISKLLYLGFQYRLEAYVTTSALLNQSMSVIGSTGFLFLLLWISSVITYLFEYIALKRNVIDKKGLTVFSVIVIVVAFFGAFRMNSEQPQARSVKVAMALSPYVGDFTSENVLTYEEYAGALEKNVKEAAESDAELLLCHEEMFCLAGDEAVAAFEELAATLAQQYGIHILLGEEVYYVAGCEQGKGLNRLKWIDPNGNELFTYNKHSLIPIVEESYYTRGEKEIPVIDVPFACGNVRVASIICYDSNFSDNVKTIPSDTELLLIPSWDWKPVTAYHREVTRELAIENGVTVVKNTYDGISTVIDPLGKTVIEYDSADTSFGSVTVTEVPLAARNTVFNRVRIHGNRIMACLTIVGVIALEIMERRKRKGMSR